MRVVNKKLWVITITLLVVIECVFTYLSVKSYGNKDITEIKEENKVDKEMFSIYVEQEDESYKEYIDTNLFTIDGYELNVEKSNCVDNKGNIVNGVLSNSGNKVTVSSNKTSYCYLYFSLKETAGEYLLENPSKGLILSSLQGGLYRYQGTNDVDNYICLGYLDYESNCDFTNANNSDLYAYRIIGISQNGQLKIIKKEALNNTLQWWSDYNTNITWPNSLTYTALNGDDFLLNKTYINSEFENKISLFNWKYGDATNGNNYNGPAIYAIEDAWQDTVPAKIGLMYLHDYYFAYPSGLVENSNNASSSWLHLSNNDEAYPKDWEIIMDRYYYYERGQQWIVWGIFSSGLVVDMLQTFEFSVRPVFYLNHKVYITKGSGTIDDPYIIS